MLSFTDWSISPRAPSKPGAEFTSRHSHPRMGGFAEMGRLEDLSLLQMEERDCAFLPCLPAHAPPSQMLLWWAGSV